MDIERLARKLAPLMPKEVEHWLRIRDLGDAELRDLVEKQIVAAAESVLGDYRRKALLSLPPEKQARGEIHLGTVLYEKPKWPAGLSMAELLQNLAIFGRSGSGKTNLVFHILKQLSEKRIPYLFLDWKQTARHLLPQLKQRVNVYTPGRSLSPLPFNPLLPPPGMELRVYLNQVIDVLADAYTLGDGARSVLQKALTRLSVDGRTPTLTQLLEAVESMEGKSRERSWQATALRALQSLVHSGLAGSDESRDSQEGIVEGLGRESSIIELDALNQSSKKFLIPMLCLWLYRSRLIAPDRERLRLVIVVEEAHHVLYGEQQRSKESLMEMLLRQCREIGIGIIVIDQHPHLISSAALGNTYASICLNQKDPKDINKAAALSLVPEEEKHLFSRLPVGRAVVKLQDRWTEPFIVQVPEVEVRKGAVTDEILASYVADRRAGSGSLRRVKASVGEVRQVRFVDDGLEDRALSFMHDVVKHADDGVKARYRRLGIGTGTGNHLKERLIETGWLEAQRIAIGTSRKVLLRLTRRAVELLGIDARTTRASLAHEYWKRFYACMLEQQGYAVELEVSRNGGTVDVLAQRDGKRIAVEIETGKSNAVDNVRRCLRSGIRRVLVVATDATAMDALERELAETGLLIADRVELMRAGKDIQPRGAGQFSS